MNVDEMLSKISSRQLTEWMAFSLIEPFGYEADMLGHGVVAASVYNSKRTKPTQKFFEPSEFIPQMKEKKRPSAREFFDNLKTMILLKKEKNK